jgi:hypothetical protein
MGSQRVYESESYLGFVQRSMREILNDVVDVFGDGLRVVICCQGRDVLEDFKQYAPKNYRNLEAMDKTLGGSLENPTSSSFEKEAQRHNPGSCT